MNSNNFGKDYASDLTTWSIKRPDILTKFWEMGENWVAGFETGLRTLRLDKWRNEKSEQTR